MKQIPSFPEYQVTLDGQVFNSRGMKLSDHACNGYRRISLKNIRGKRVGVDIHRLVLEAYKGPIPKHLEVNHINGDKADNRLENLELVTHKQNMQHAKDSLGVKFGSPRDEIKREAIKALVSLGWTQPKIAKAFGVSQPNISQLLNS